jgi:hypothetical protein
MQIQKVVVVLKDGCSICHVNVVCNLSQRTERE